VVVGEVTLKSNMTRANFSQPEPQMSFENPRRFRFKPNRFKLDQDSAEVKTAKIFILQSVLIQEKRLWGLPVGTTNSSQFSKHFWFSILKVL